MSEEMKKMSAFEAFKQTQQTFAEAEEKVKKEAGTPRVERFRIGEDGEYLIRILPLAPDFDNEGNILPMERKGYEYALHQQFLGIEIPNKKGGKPKKINVPVICTTDKEVGYSVDLIDTYVKIAKEIYADDEDLVKLITDSNYTGGLRWGFQHAIMILDVSSEKERSKGPQLFQCSHSQYKDIDAAKMRLWKELREDGGQETCPISHFTDAYPVKIIRSNNNGKTEYTVEIGRKTMDLRESELDQLLDLPRIPEQIYRYTRYQFEATLAFLKQYDEKHEMEVCKESDFIDAVDKLRNELPADDTSHFDLSGANSKGSEKEEVTIESLWREYDAIVDQELNEKSDEYQDLREKIRQFIEDQHLDVRISRSKNNQQLLEEIDSTLNDKRFVQPAADKADEVEDVVEEPEKEEEEPRKRRPRPGSEEPAVAEEDIKESQPEEPVEEAPARRVRARRLR